MFGNIKGTKTELLKEINAVQKIVLHESFDEWKKIAGTNLYFYCFHDTSFNPPPISESTAHFVLHYTPMKY